MQESVVIVTPSAELSLSLEEVLRESDFCPTTIRGYPSSSGLKSAVPAEQHLAAVLIDFADETRAMHLLWRLHRDEPDLPLIIVNGSPKLSSVVQTRTAGAWGYLPGSYTRADLQTLAALLRQEQHPQTDEEAAHGRLVSFLPAQGGSGASTIALHVAAAVADQDGGRSVLVDFDLHTGTAAFQLGLRPETTLLSALISQDISEESISRAVVRKGNLDVLVGASGAEDLRSDTFQRVPELFSQLTKMYRHVFIDLPPHLCSSSIDVLTQSDSVYLVCTPEITSLHLAKRKILCFGSRGIPLDGVRILVNRATSWGSVNQATLTQIVGLPVAWVIDNDYPSVYRAAMEGGLVAESSVLRGQFTQFAAQITNRLVAEPVAVQSHTFLGRPDSQKTA